MSLQEQSLHEDYIDTLATIDRTANPPRRPSRNGQGNVPMRTLDVDSPTPRHGSIAGIGVGVTSPRQQEKKSTRLDPSDPSTWTSRHSSKPNSPTLTKSQPAARQDADGDDDWPQSYVGLPRSEKGPSHPQTQRAMSDSGPSRPRDSPRAGALAAALTGKLEELQVNSPPSPQKNLQKAAAHSRSPSGRVVQSPATEKGNALSPTKRPSASHHHTTSSFSTLDSGSDLGQVKVDQPTDELALDESSEDDPSADSEDESRGRERDRTDKTSNDLAEVSKDLETPASPEPAISITSPDGERIPSSDTVVQVPTNEPEAPQDRRMSVSTTASTEGDDHDIAKAKTLGLSISPLDTKVPDRHVRMIIRGDWDRFNKEAEAGDRSTRTYLACSDLSNEATYALEWTIGTILRDGDTLLCVYSIEDETAGTISSNDDKVSSAEKERLHQEGAQAGKEAMSVMEGLTRQTTNRDNEPMHKFIPATEAKSATGSVDARKVSKKEMERLRAIDEITQTFLRFVRKTSLQVRCMIEVIHCKSPKHLILGAVS
jgi:hypothetical protein